VVASRSVYYWQVSVTIYSSIIAIIIIGKTMPLATKKDNIMEYFNESMILLVCYNTMIFTDWVSDVEMQYKGGYVCIGVVFTHIGVNIS